MKLLKVILLGFFLVNIILGQESQTNLLDSLKGYYSFNNDAYDHSGYNNNAQSYGVSPTSGRFGFDDGAFKFDGINDYIQIPNSNSLNLNSLSTDYTISLWFRSDSPTLQQGIYTRLFSKWNENIHTPYPIAIVAGYDRLNASVYDGSSIYNTQMFGSQVWDGQWHYIVFMLDHVNRKIYGFLDSDSLPSISNTITTSTANADDIYIGVTPGYERYFNGEVDELRIYNRLLNNAEIQELYIYDNNIVTDFSADTLFGDTPLTVKFEDKSISSNVNYPIKSWKWDFDNDGVIDSYDQNPEYTYNEPGIYSVKLIVSDSIGSNIKIISNYINTVPKTIVGFYPLNGSFLDYSGFENNGIVNGATLSIDRFGNENSAYTFDGYNDFANIPNSQIINFDASMNSYSMSLWVKSDNPQNGTRVFSKWNENIKTPYPFSMQMSLGICNIAIYDGLNSNRIHYGDIWDGEWHHIVFIYNLTSAELKGYLDGSLVEENNYTLTQSTSNENDIVIALKPSHSELFKGSIDDIRLFNYALSESEALGLYQEGDSFEYLKVEFEADTTFGFGSLHVSFTDKSLSSDSSKSIQFWAWDFQNDGVIDSYEQNPTFFYDSPGDYSVKLTISDLTNSKTIVKENFISVVSRAPQILSIEDIPDDQGGWVLVNFNRCVYDTDSLILPKTGTAELYTVETNDGSGWVAGTSTAAYGKPMYSVLVHTSKDSTNDTNGIIDFRVIAAMTEGNFASPVAQGYSKDNIFPNIPKMLNAMINNGFVRLQWSPNKDIDLKEYRIYKSNDAGALERLTTTIDTIFIDDDIQIDKEYSYAITAIDVSGNESGYSNIIDLKLTNLENNDYLNKYYLSQNYPNPFNPSTIINFGIIESGKVKIIIYDVLGNKVIELINNVLSAGNHQVIWNGLNQYGDRVSSGIFYYQIISDNYTETKKMILVK